MLEETDLSLRLLKSICTEPRLDKSPSGQQANPIRPSISIYRINTGKRIQIALRATTQFQVRPKSSDYFAFGKSYGGWVQKETALDVRLPSNRRLTD